MAAIRNYSGYLVDGGLSGALTDRGGQVYNVKATDWGAVGDGVTNDATAINAAITAANAAGGGTVYLPPATYAISATVTLKSNVLLRLAPGAQIYWTGSAGGTMVATGTAAPTVKTGVIGGQLNTQGAAGIVLDLHSVQFSHFADFEVTTGSATSVVIKIKADATATTGGYETKRNSVLNVFERLVIGECGTAIHLEGYNNTSTDQGIITLNTFRDINAYDVRVSGVRVVQWADNNVFEGMCRLNLNASNAVGVVFNDSATNTADVGVYSNYFHVLAVDSFSGLGQTGRKAVVLNKTKANVIRDFYNDPVAEGGVLVDNNSDSHVVERFGTPSDVTIYRYQKSHSIQGNQTIVGQLGVGAAPGGALDVTQAVTDPTVAGVLLSPAVSYSTAGKAIISSQATVIPTAALAGTVYGLIFIPTFGTAAANANNVTTAMGIFARVDTGSGYTGTVSGVNGIYVANPNKANGSASMGTVYGVSIEPMTTGSFPIGLGVGAGSFATLWLSNNVDGTGPSQGVFFGASRDTNLYRSAASTLKTDGTFVAGAGLNCNGVLGGTGVANGALAATVTTTSSTLGTNALTGLGFSIGASETWTAEWQLTVTGSTGGMKFDVTGPASPTGLRLTVEGNTSAVTSTSVETITAFSTASAAYASGGITGRVVVKARIRNGANAGTVQLRFGSATNTESTSVLIDSYMTARRTA